MTKISHDETLLKIILMMLIKTELFNSEVMFLFIHL